MTKSVERVENSADPDQKRTSDLGTHCLLIPACPNILGYYGNKFKFKLVYCMSSLCIGIHLWRDGGVRVG